MPPRNHCRLCGATSYRRLVERDARGELRPHPSLYRCSGCSVVFADPRAWRGIDDDAPPASPPAAPRVPTVAEAPRPPDFRTYGATPLLPPRG